VIALDKTFLERAARPARDQSRARPMADHWRGVWHHPGARDQGLRRTSYALHPRQPRQRRQHASSDTTESGHQRPARARNRARTPARTHSTWHRITSTAPRTRRSSNPGRRLNPSACGSCGSLARRPLRPARSASRSERCPAVRLGSHSSVGLAATRRCLI
jgi:hypothetical protein